MSWYDNIPAQADGGWYGMQIMKHVRPREWIEALERVPAEHRDRAQKYLQEQGALIEARREVKDG